MRCRRSRSVNASGALDREGSREDVKTAAITLSAQVASTYYQLAEQRAQHRVLGDQIGLNEQTVLVALREVEDGLVQERRQQEYVSSLEA